ncbi:ImmA/IrrE family metallo-endopeptidase [Elioraea sp. Yellowstone]|jgi:predicted transcriptional regulator/transcriptional regulator with XRE-family HTH domain|uniref:helix-turn-helix domain-containing protein n=1 Tax=Elioraea sp. Yellowstone TaxID=2592070 RepID=UPI00114FEC79|nr:helix-turn-helix transcriptional regulator [Elioraea sp. Yellowstone]TQF77422.1 ImmA/IrrE family metallo-endopeptidase [Elioraea sp. Yellowstone]
MEVAIASKPRIGRTVRRLRIERGLTQQALAAALGISASYLNLIEHDQRGVTAALLLKLARHFAVDLAALGGAEERQTEAHLREAFADPLLGAEAVPEGEIAALVDAAPAAARATLALYRAWRAAREDTSGLSLPSGRRILLPTEEARDHFHARRNHFPRLEAAAEVIHAGLGAALPAEMNHAIAERLRRTHGLRIAVGDLAGALRRFDAETRTLHLSDLLPRESRGFQMAFQLMLIEAQDAVEEEVAEAKPSSEEAAALLRVGLLNYAAGALLMPYDAYLAAARSLRHDVDALAARFGVSFEQAAHRLTTLNREGARGIAFFFLRADAAGNVTKRFAAAGFPFARFGGSCPRWVPHLAFASPGRVQVQVARLPDGATFLCFAKALARPAGPWPEPPEVHVVALGCDVAHAGSVAYADGLDLEASVTTIGLSCPLCDRPNCRSRAFPAVAHRLALDPSVRAAGAFGFAPRRA